LEVLPAEAAEDDMDVDIEDWLIEDYDNGLDDDTIQEATEIGRIAHRLPVLESQGESKLRMLMLTDGMVQIQKVQSR